MKQQFTEEMVQAGVEALKEHSIAGEFSVGGEQEIVKAILTAAFQLRSENEERRA